MKKLRIGVIGAGANTRLRHIPGFKEIEGVSVDVVCNRSEGSSRSVADAFDIPRIAKDWKEVVADPEIDAICIGTWPYLHAEITVAALAAGKHVLTEARMAMNTEEGEAMVEASLNRPELVAQIVPSPFTLKWDATIKKILASGELGELREVSFTKALGLNVDSKAPLNWRQDRALSGNNTLMLGIYYEVVQRWLGEEPDRLLASGAVFTKQRQKGANGELVEVEIPETIDVIAEYESGLRLVGRMTGLELGSGSDGYVIAGSKGTLRMDLKAGKLSKCLLGGKETVVEPAPEDVADWNVEADFVNSIREGAPIELTNFADGLAYMRFTDAAIKSLAEDSVWVSV
ncbi:Gfo/Idh/MocA family oxidoreductase [Pelagicoccus sp. NFK12]|uniref:Gfo/Idh/MocA family oxidoreductase n=1 Tax=Pelagicoccus enzymogenes TaxID=2773457 RepID=A0A927IG97_9BACT|nr:Gfo/Idh/MocA family oxidoreductase [Pelagicoccus enzymogenes]MBD5778155.1 Gfo/Idh/MocA family oxidoreductase [Pelagicoccus enzymogenes]MDQ8198088.1 Gfo/Idh/MocA family oxidoreductase [Pelagicoccus enzymogenes]